MPFPPPDPHSFGPGPLHPVAYGILPLLRLSPLFPPAPAALSSSFPPMWSAAACQVWPSLDAAEQDVVDGDVDELDEEADEAHDQEPHARGIGYPGKLCTKVSVKQGMRGEEVRGKAWRERSEGRRRREGKWWAYLFGPAWCTS